VDLYAEAFDLAQHELAGRSVKLAVERIALTDEDGDVGNGRHVVHRLGGFEA
jgi:hypothetical protein